MDFITFLLTHSPIFYFTQSLWRDEVYSILYASQNFGTILTKSVLEPPLYYLLLHGWMKIFGSTDIAARSLSLVGFSLTIILLIEWASKKFRSKFLQRFIPLLFALNPMLLFYAFEARAYTWYLFFFVLSFIAYDAKRWKLFTVATLLAFFTHYYSAVFTIALVIHFAVTHKRSPWSKSHIFQSKFFRGLCIIVLISLPQIVRVFLQMKFNQSSWYFPVDLHLIQSILGNMFLGYEGTPWYLWPRTAMLSIVLLIVMIIPLFYKKCRKNAWLAISIVFIPLFLVIGISFYKPYFVSRYLIPVTFGQILLTAYAVSLIPMRKLKISVGVGIVMLLVLFNMWYPVNHAKVDYRSSLKLANLIAKENDLIYSADELNFFETLFYAQDRTKVRLYNPSHVPFLWYIGDMIFSPSYNISTIPSYPAKAIMIRKDGSVEILTIGPPMTKK